MAHSPQQIADYHAKLDHFAELLSRGLSIPQIRERMGIPNGSAQKLMLAIRTQLGWQAQ